MYNQVSEISEKRLEVLHHLDTHQGEIYTIRKLANLRVEGEPSESDIEGTRRLVKRMHDDGLVNYESSYSGSKISLTTTGAEEIENTPYPPGNVGGNVGGDLERFHGFVVEARILSDTPSDWMGVMQEKGEVEIIDDRDSQTTVAKDIWNIRLHKDFLTLQLREGCSISGKDSAEVFQRAHSQAQSVCSWLEGAAGIKVQVEHFRIKNAELGFEGHPLAELAGDLPGVPLDRFSIEDPDLRTQVLTIDGSPGWTEELEAQSEMTEEISQNIEDEMMQLTRRDAIRERHGFENELVTQDISGQEAVHILRQSKGVQDQLQSTVTDVEGLKDEVQDMNTTQQMIAENLQELQQSRQQEKDTRDALMELVRSNQNVVKQNNERMERQEEIIEQQKEIIEGQQEQISELSEKVEGLKDELENVKKEQGTDSVDENTDSVRSEVTLSGPRPLDGQSIDVPGEDVELESVEIDTEDRSGIGKDVFNDTSKQDCSNIGKGMVFRDLRDGGKLLEVWEVNLREGSDGYYDEVKVRVCGTRKVWATMPRAELSRLLDTGRLKIVDVPDPPE